MGENTEEIEQSYSLHEKNIYPDWDLDPVPEDVELEQEYSVEERANLENEPEVTCLHKELLASSALTKDFSMIELARMNLSFFYGYRQEDEKGLFPDGISMSLWKDNTSGHLFLVGVSEPVSYVGVLTEKMGEYGALRGELSFNRHSEPAQNIPLKFYFLNRKQEFLGLLDKWAEGIKHSAKIATLDRYMVLTNYKLNGYGVINAWRNIEELQNPLLYLITNSMLYHFGRTSLDNGNATLREWLTNNTIIPRQS